jgi:excisionase family DNA binding protein
MTETGEFRLYKGPTNLRPLSVTVDDALALSGIGRTTLYDLIAKNTIETIKIGRRRLVVYESLARLLRPAA